ncbi:MAG TPA: phage tail assembly chaperone [Buttiauxella sp.]|nr:phage tail assembly chaperone [Buttiauxella sp.]
MEKKNLKALALAPLAGFRHVPDVVPEWEGAIVILREPSASGWLRWQEVAGLDTDEQESVSEKARRGLRGDVALFIDILRDENMQPVFCEADQEEVEKIYGPVHSRLLKKALGLTVITNAEEAEKK